MPRFLTFSLLLVCLHASAGFKYSPSEDSKCSKSALLKVEDCIGNRGSVVKQKNEYFKPRNEKEAMERICTTASASLACLQYVRKCDPTGAYAEQEAIRMNVAEAEKALGVECTSMEKLMERP